MIFYLGSPGSPLQANACRDRPVLISYGAWAKANVAAWVPSFSRLLVDSGAYSELNSGVKIDIDRYIEWASGFPFADAVACLDDISGDWRRSMANYVAQPDGFPTFHDTDPPELLDELIAMARERNRWLGIGVKPPRQRRLDWLDRTLEQIPREIHVHGWALALFTDRCRRRLDSVDSTHWWRESHKYLADPKLSHLTPAECLEIAVKKVDRWPWMEEKASQQRHLFAAREATDDE